MKFILYYQGDGYLWPNCCMNNLYISHRTLREKTRKNFIQVRAFESSVSLNLCMLGNCSCFFFSKLTFSKEFFQEHNHECQTVWIQIRTDILLVLIWVQTVCKDQQQFVVVCILSVLIWVQTVCKGYQQTTKSPLARKEFEHSLLTFVKVYLFQRILSGTLSECQTVWIQIRPDRMLGLIWVQTVCIDQQQFFLSSADFFQS